MTATQPRAGGDDGTIQVEHRVTKTAHRFDQAGAQIIPHGMRVSLCRQRCLEPGTAADDGQSFATISRDDIRAAAIAMTWLPSREQQDVFTAEQQRGVATEGGSEREFQQTLLAELSTRGGDGIDAIGWEGQDDTGRDGVHDDVWELGLSKLSAA